MHLNEDDLILHYYGEAQGAEAGITAHLDACAECGAAWQQLRRVMEAIDAAPVPEPSPSFERNVWARLESEVFREHSTGKSSGWRAWFSGPRLALAGGLAAIVFVVGALRMSTTAPPAETLAGDTAAGAHREQVMLTAVSDHIEQSQVVLVELANAEPDGDDIDVSLERDAADDLVSAGRLYRETARETGNLQLAALLEELELVLVEIARGPGALSAEELDALRAQIEAQQLIFKLQVLGADVKARRESATEFKPQRTL